MTTPYRVRGDFNARERPCDIVNSEIIENTNFLEVSKSCNKVLNENSAILISNFEKLELCLLAFTLQKNNFICIGQRDRNNSQGLNGYYSR